MQVLLPALHLLLQHPDWSRFSHNISRYQWPPELVAQTVAADDAWLRGRAERKAAQENARQQQEQDVDEEAKHKTRG